MALIEIRRPSKRELRVFGLLVGLFFGLIGGLVWFKAKTPAPTSATDVIWAIGGALMIIYYAVPRLRLVLYYGWMKAAYPIGWTISHLVLGITYYLVLTPIGLFMRVFGHDPMQRRFDRDASSYWVEHNPGADPARYFRQF